MIVFEKERVKAPVAQTVPAVAPPAALSHPVETPAEETPRPESSWRVLPLDGRFEFSYLDAAGRPSRRRLDAAELKVGPGKLLLGGVDADLDAYRGFRVDRIRALRASGSDEVVDRNIVDWLLDRAARLERAARRAVEAETREQKAGAKARRLRAAA